MLQAPKDLLTRLADKLFQRRGPETDLTLRHRRIFVLPSKAGLLFSATLITLLIAAINYQLSLGYLLTFGLGATAWLGLHWSFANLAGLRFTAARSTPVFAGELAAFEFEASDTRRRNRFAIRVGSATGDVVFHVERNGSRRATIEALTETRGWFEAPRTTIETRFPLGLWRAWSYWQPAMRCLVYPRPEQPAHPLPMASAFGAESTGSGPGNESVASLRPYLPGDSPRIIAWKAYARSGSDLLVSKQFEGSTQGELWLDERLTGSGNREAAISRLTAWVLEADSASMEYGLRVGAAVLGPASGPAHRDACLEALALA
ncbi:DUF58 domain-containing protein [soil metagenome]